MLLFCLGLCFQLNTLSLGLATPFSLKYGYTLTSHQYEFDIPFCTMGINMDLTSFPHLLFVAITASAFLGSLFTRLCLCYCPLSQKAWLTTGFLIHTKVVQGLCAGHGSFSTPNNHTVATKPKVYNCPKCHWN